MQRRMMEESTFRMAECKLHLNSLFRDTNNTFHLSKHLTLPQMLTEHSFVGLRAIAYTEKQVSVYC